MNAGFLLSALGSPRLLSEHSYGVWKKRSPALLYTLRKDKQEHSQATVFASGVLHNIAIDLKEDEPSLPASLNISEEMFKKFFLETNDEEPFVGEDDNKYVREMIIKNFFSH